jgi:hypothetical protein
MAAARVPVPTDAACLEAARENLAAAFRKS